MPSTDSTDGNIVYGQFHISVKYKNLRFPLDPRTVAYFVIEKGWIVPPEMATLPLGGQITGSGLIASKASSQLRFNTEGNNLAVVGRNPDQVTADFEEVEIVIKEQIDFDGIANADYYELIAAGYIASSIEPSRAWKQLGEKLQIKTQMPSILSEAPALFGIHLQKPDQLPSDIEWWDLSLALQVIRPDKYHTFHFVKRSANRQDVLTAAKAATALIRNTVEAIQ